MLPKDIVDLIWEYHDQFDVAGKKRRVNYIVSRAYRNWLTDTGAFSVFFPGTEFSAKKEIFPVVESDIFITNRSSWDVFLNYFVYFEKFMYLDFTPALPSNYARVRGSLCSVVL